MESTSPFSNEPLSHSRNNKLKERNKQINYSKSFLRNYGCNSGSDNRNNNNNGSPKQLLDYPKPKEKFSYDTLDSAYGTGESSYNTVDSSYSQRSKSFGYGTLDFEWRNELSTFELEKHKESSKRDALPVNVQASESFGANRSFQLPHAEAERIKYVDDLDDSDTATETGTDTELSVSSSTIDTNMSYVPYYIRPIAAPVSVRALTTTTSSFTTSRPILTSTRTSPSVSVTSSTLTSPSGSVIDENITLSPKATSYKRSDKKTSYAGYREDYVLKQKEKLCGRKSLDERLKSLEAGAAVKLQVCKGSKNRRRWSDGREMVSTIRSIDPTAKLYSRPRSPVREAEEDHTKQALQIQPTPSIVPLQDTAESNQPSDVQISLPRSDSACSSTSKDSRSKLLPPSEADFSSQSEDLTSQSLVDDASDDDVERDSKMEETETDAKPDPVCTDRNQTPSPVHDSAEQQRELHPDSVDVESNASPSNAEDDAESDPAPEVSIEETPDVTHSPVRTEPPVTELAWKEPAEEVVNRLDDSFEKKHTPPISQVQGPSSEQSDVQIIKDAAPVVRREGSVQRRGAPGPLVIDIATGDRVVPVELRSPRGDAGGFGRSNMRGKRDARVFVLPSSDDSESDNILAKLNRSISNRPVHVAPVKFVPSVLRRARSRSARDESSESSSSSLVANVKVCCIPPNPTNLTTSNDESKSTALKLPKEHRRKSSRSPKRTNSKKSNRSKSSHDRPKAEWRRTRTLSSGSRPMSSDATCGTDQHDKPLEITAEISNRRLKEKSSARSSSNRRKAECSDVPYVEGAPPLGHQNVQEAANLPSPRQQAVADVVKFGFSGNEGAIPYIDESCGPEGRKVPAANEAEGEAAASDDFLLRDADSATIRMALPLTNRGRSGKSKEGPRRTSYMEAMESIDDLTPDPDTDGSGYGAVRLESDREQQVALGKYGRSNSADSILSTTEVQPDVVLRKRPRASSADRNSLKGVYRRSYQIATTTPVDNTALLRLSQHKRQPSIKKIKNFFAENAQQAVEGQAEDGRRGTRGRPPGPPPFLVLNEYDDTVAKEGFLYFKVATIEKGKRTSSQKSWKLVWVVLKDQSLYLCKDWSRNRADASPGAGLNNSSPRSMSGHAPLQLPLEEEEPLNIQGSLVSIAYNYVKRKNVFKVTTCNGSEYLLQADDRDDMLAWINSIQVSGNHDNEDGEVTINEDLILRKSSQIESGPKTDKRGAKKSRSPKPARRVPAVPVKDVDGSRRFRWKGSVNRIVRKFGQGQTLMQGGTFEVHLEDCPPSASNEFVPFVVDLCCRVVEERGLSFTGIYRVPGNSGTLTALQEELNFRGADAIDLENDPRFCDLNVVSSLLKSFFRNLPDPLFTNELYDDFVLMNRNKDPEQRLNGLRRLIHILPPPHYETLKFLMTHLRKVADNSSVNKMEIRNLAIVFGPTLVRSTESDNMVTMVTDMSDQCRIIESILKHCAWFFTDEVDRKAEVRVPPAPSEERHEPVPNIDHLLANVGRTPGDVSDSASESSKSKASCASEKESFSRDVIEMIFGAGKKWMPDAQQRDARNDGEESSDDEFGFKEAKRNQAKPPAESPTTPPATVATRAAAPLKHQVAKPAACGVKSTRPNQEQHLPHDIPARLYDFYVESLERLARTDISRPLPYFSSSSAETSPQVTPRSSWLVPPRIPAHRKITYQAHRPPEVRLSNGGAHEKPNTSRHPNATSISLASQPAVPSSYGDLPSNPPTLSQRNKDSYPALLTGAASRRSQPSNKEKPVQITDNQPGLPAAGKSSTGCNEESDSDTSIYIGDTLEEKLRNLTNLDKKLERRPSRRHANSNYDVLLEITPMPTAPLKPVNKKLTTAPSMQAGELITPDNFHMYPSKKTRELYQERKARRHQNNDNKKSIRSSRDSDLERCASDENVFNRFEPKRQGLRPGLRDDVNVSRRSRQSSEKVKRRHTLGGNDFPVHHFWDQSHHASLQNIYRDVPWSAMARLPPNFGASAPSVHFKHTSATHLLNHGNSFRPEMGLKTESYI